MLRRLLRIALWLGVLAGIAAALTKLLSSQAHEPPALATAPSGPWPRLDADPTAAASPTTRAVPDPEAPAPVAAPAWVEPVGGGCPASHPVKAKLSSRIFHLPGMANYDRTTPDRCYVDAAAAEADGLRAAKR